MSRRTGSCLVRDEYPVTPRPDVDVRREPRVHASSSPREKIQSVLKGVYLLYESRPVSGVHSSNFPKVLSLKFFEAVLTMSATEYFARVKPT